MIARDTTKVAVDPVALSKQAGYTKRRLLHVPVVGRLTLGGGSASALRGLGDVWDDLEIDITEETKNFFQKVWDNLVHIFSFGSGAEEADEIVPVQNQLMDKLGAITNQFLTGTNPSLETLYNLVRQVREYSAYFHKFVAEPIFIDGRASAQALNTVMPYIDGSCGYHEHVLVATAFNCLSWGDGTLGGVGTNGMLGALSRAIVNRGGDPPDVTALDQNHLPDLSYYATAGFSTPLAVGLGLLVLFMFSRKR